MRNKIMFNNVDKNIADERLLKIEKRILKETSVQDRVQGNIVVVDGLWFGFDSRMVHLDAKTRTIMVQQLKEKSKIVRIN